MSEPIFTAADLAELHASGFEASWSEADFEGHIQRKTDPITPLFKGGVLIGFALLRLAVDQAEILTIVIHPDVQKQGLGEELLRRAEQDALSQGADIIFLDVAADNPAAISLYRKSAYREYGKRPGYYKRSYGRIGALLFQKRLK